MAVEPGMAQLSGVLDDRIGTRVRNIARLIIDAKAAAFRPLGITVPQYSTLLALKHLQPSSAAQLARSGLGTPQSIATMLTNLERKDLISRQASPLHQKLVEVRLTEVGERTIDDADELAASIERGLRAAIGEELFESLASIERIAAEQLGD